MAFSPMLDTSMEQGVSQARPCEAANPTRGEADAGNPGSPEGTQPPHHCTTRGGQVKPAARTGEIWGKLGDHNGALSSAMRP
jgi:hypothetical protein